MNLNVMSSHATCMKFDSSLSTASQLKTSSTSLQLLYFWFFGILKDCHLDSQVLLNLFFFSIIGINLCCDDEFFLYIAVYIVIYSNIVIY